MICALGSLFSMNAQDVTGWKVYIPQGWTSKITKLGQLAQKALLKSSLGLALLSEKKFVLLPKGSYFENNNQELCGFYPLKKTSSRFGKTLSGWVACLSDEGLNYGEAEADCTLKQSLKFKDQIGQYPNPSHAKKPRTTRKSCYVYPVQG